MSFQKEKFEKLVEHGVLEKSSKSGDYVHVHAEENCEGFLESMEKMNSSGNVVWIVGYPKTGSHFVQGILKNLGCKLSTDVKDEKEGTYIEWNPLENQRFGTKAIKLLESAARTHEASDVPLVMPHSHLPFCSFPSQIAGNKVIFVDRDPRATAASAFHFFCEKKDEEDTVYIEPYVKTMEVNEDINKFTELFFTGNFYYGDYFKYNNEWKKNFNAKYQNAEILYLKFEDLKNDLPAQVLKIADFLGFENVDAQKIAQESSFKSMSKKKVKVERKEDFNSKLYRRGKSEGWKSEIDALLLAKFALKSEKNGYPFYADGNLSLYP